MAYNLPLKSWDGYTTVIVANDDYALGCSGFSTNK